MSEKVEKLVNGVTLDDYGEFRLINEVIKPILVGVSSRGFGDDCAHLGFEEPGELVISSDATPTPLSRQLGDCSFETWGWYSGLINASDLAAAGAKPVALTNSVEAPGDMLVSDLCDFFRGLADFCRSFSILSAGGNIRQGQKFSCHSTIIGRMAKASVLGRSGCNPGDAIVSIGPCGEFISVFLKARKYGLQQLPESERALLLRPRPQLEAMLPLNEASLLSAASDNSDGVIGAMWNIAEASNCAIEVDMRDELIPARVRDAAGHENVNPWNLMFCWGDWQVISAVPLASYSRFVQEAKSRSIVFTLLGHARKGEARIYGSYKSTRYILPILRNEAFSLNSFGSHPLGHVQKMLKTNLFVEGVNNNPDL